jgi:hypothetical protein
MGSQWITFFSIVEWRMLCGMLFLVGLGCVGLCLAQLKSYSLVGGRVVARGVLWFGRWFICVLCGVFGGNVMQNALKTRRGLLRKFFIIFFLLFTLGLSDGLPRL